MLPSADRSSSDASSSLVARDRLNAHQLFDSAIVFWIGTSGHAYVHTIYKLIGCPAVPPASVLFVRKSAEGNRTVLGIISVDHAVPSQNLAQIRQTGSQLGADEVHLHFATGNRFARHTATIDLRTRHGNIELVGK
jgi:hypothetical protein